MGLVTVEAVEASVALDAVHYGRAVITHPDGVAALAFDDDERDNRSI